MRFIRIGIRTKMKKTACALRRAAKSIADLWRRRRAGIIYYGAVGAVLIAIALAADGYRDRRAAEITQSEPAQMMLASPTLLDASAAEPEKLAPRLPSGTNILRAFSDAPTLNEALGQWEAHDGTDICYENGDVLALCAGTVEEISQDDRLGCTIAVRTGDDIIRYMGVEEPAVRAGGRVDAGECIARQSDRVRCESHLGAHVHIEAVIDGENIDIEPLLQKESAY